MKPSVYIRFWGVRGSVGSAGESTKKYGGNTACVEIECGQTRIICDAGSGIRPLGNELKRRSRNRPIRAAILLTHLHWDHFVGLPFFEPLYNKQNVFVIAGPGYGKKSFKEELSRAIAPPFFPITPDKFSAKIKYRTLEGGEFAIDDVLVKPFKCNHPGGALGWRFIFPGGKSLIYVSDHEAAGNRNSSMTDWMRGADIAIHDAQYSEDQYRRFKGWGHSPYGHVVRTALKAGVKMLVLYHHDPESDDEVLERRLHHAREIALGLGSNMRIELSKEGKELRL